jgi:hypothetical protein
MEVLRNLFGNVTSGAIRLAVIVGVFAAAYFFFVKPVLHTTDNAIENADKTFERSFGSGAGLDDIGRTIQSVNRQVQAQIKRSFHAADLHGNPQKLVRCIERARGDVHGIRRCTVKY